MGTRSLIQLCVRKKDGKLIVFAVIYNQWDGHYDSLGAKLASFLEGAVLVNGYSSTTNEHKEFNGPEDLFPRIITYLKVSPENSHSPFLEPLDTQCTCDWQIEYVYKVIVVEKEDGSQEILFEAEGGSIEDEETEEIRSDNFSGSPADFVKKYARENDSYLYKPVLPYKKRTREQLDEERRTLIKRIKELANSFDGQHDGGYKGLFKREQLVALLDALVYPH
jgi:hypothetical protein